MNNTQLNINNLTQLWQVAGQSFKSYFKEASIYYIYITNSEWPNRIWTDASISEDIVHSIQSKMDGNATLTFSYFNDKKTKSPLVDYKCFSLKSVQYGMSLTLKGKFMTQIPLEFKRVTNKSSAQKWHKTFYEAFNYNISTETIIKTKNDIQYVLVYHKKAIIGTVLLFTTNHVIGIHSLGIRPKHRKKGYANEIMHQVLNMAIDQKVSIATLQASEMAKGMYEKMGFTIDFLMENYTQK
ncbi:GNAT family N-acetyltransferase [Snuella sedimenti]|uniref:GNAT family N-acetyltransferase n=1 Tax=Snuella sedimenti TaxID=2798802 RepID=A0A8J7LRC9_9FLAO|nr:GNAT family N-acetyltransferase [Snuella sedimenti]MBJ6367035.1 GNAT family N-acetyltransferase [Snuella sedimenti]